MTTNFSSFGNELSLNELAAIATGKEGELFAGEYQSSGKQVGSMTISEVMDFYDSQKLNYCVSFGANGSTVTLKNSDWLFPTHTTYFIPHT